MPKRGENPSAAASMIAQIAGLPVRGYSSREDAIKVPADLLPGAYGAVVKAAKARRISVSSYIRRAVLAFAAHDLEMPLRELVAIDPRMARDTNQQMPDPEGRRFGPWEIESLHPEFQ